MRSDVARYWPVAIFAPLLVLHVGLFDFVTDDAFISMVYARNLVRHGQLVYNVGERVEGYTNFLWTVLLAACHAIGFSMERASRVLALGFSIGTLFIVARMSLREVWWSRLVAPAILVSCTSFAAWTSGGLETALACDVRIAAEDAQLGQPEIKLGLLPGGGGTQRLPRVVGPGRAALLNMTGDPISGAQAYEWGLVEKVVPREELMEAALEIARTLAERSPHAIAVVKELARETRDLPIAEGLRREAKAHSH